MESLQSQLDRTLHSSEPLRKVQNQCTNEFTLLHKFALMDDMFVPFEVALDFIFRV